MEEPSRYYSESKKDKELRESMKEKKLCDFISTQVSECPRNLRSGINPQTSYLDLSSFSGQKIDLSKLPKSLVVLRLSGVSISSLDSLPALPALRTLYLDSCGIESLEGMPPLNNLRYLYMNNNKITSFKGAHILPQLSELDLRENAAELSAPNALQAFGCIGLNHFNGANVTKDMICKAYRKSPLVGIALRAGIEPGEVTDDDAINFMMKDINEVLKKSSKNEEKAPSRDGDDEENCCKTLTLEGSDEEGWSLVFPIELMSKELTKNDENKIFAKNLKWYMNTCPMISKDKEWELISEEQTNQIKISNSMFQHLVKVTFNLNISNSKLYEVYTNGVIGNIEKRLKLPFPVTPRVSGNPREGSLVSKMAMPVPAYCSWFIDNEKIADNVSTITLTAEHVGKQITCAIQPYCPQMPSLTFSEAVTMTEPVLPLEPTVSGIVFPDELVEGEEFCLQRHFSPNREGDSRIRIERAKSASCQWELCDEIDPNAIFYTPKKEDVDCFLRLVYEPELDNSNVPEEYAYKYDERNAFYFYSKTRVLSGLPKLSNVKIAGDPYVGRTLIAFGDYSGGKMGECGYEWYSSEEPMESYDDVENATRLEEGDNVPFITLSDLEIGRHIACFITPIRDDDAIGETVMASYSKVIADCDEELEEIEYDDNIEVNKTIFLDFDCNWFVSSTEEETGFELVCKGCEFTPQAKHIGRFVKVTKTNVTSQGHILGTVSDRPDIIGDFSLEVTSPFDTGMASIPEAIDLNGIDVIWFREKGKRRTVVDVESRKYAFTEDDIGWNIRVALTSIKEDGQVGKTTFSEPTEKINKALRRKAKIVGKPKVGESLAVEVSNDTRDEKPIIYSIKWLGSRDSNKWTPIVKYVYSSVETSVDDIKYKKVSRNKQEEELQLSDLVLPITEKESMKQIKAEVTFGEFDVTMNQETIIKPTDQVITVALTNKKTMDRIECSELEILQPDDDEETRYVVGSKFTLNTNRPADGKKTNFIWERMTFDEFQEELWEMIGEGLAYTFVDEDVGATIRVRKYQGERWFETIERKTELKAPALGAFCDLTEGDLIDQNFIIIDSVEAHGPTVSDVSITQNKEGKIVVKGRYVGGVEGNSVIYLSYIDADLHSVTTLMIDDVEGVKEDDGYTSFTIPIVPQMFDSNNDEAKSFNRVDAAYKPIRDDGVEGNLVWSNSATVVQQVPVIKTVKLSSNMDGILPPETNDVVAAGKDIYCIVTPEYYKNYKYQWSVTRPATEEDKNEYFEEQEKKKKLMEKQNSMDEKEIKNKRRHESLLGSSLVKSINQTKKGNDDKEITYDEESNTVTTTFKASDSYKYKTSDSDIDAQIMCTVWATSDRGFVSEPLDAVYEGSVTGISSLEIKIQEPVKELTSPKKQNSPTKRQKSPTKKTEKPSDSVTSGCTLEAVFHGMDEAPVKWEVFKIEKKKIEKKTEKKIVGLKVISTDLTVRIDSSFVGYYIQLSTSDDEIKSKVLGPIRGDSNFESLAKAAARANSFKFVGTAPIGSGAWKCQLTKSGFSMTGRNKVEKKTSWAQTTFTMKDSDKLEITNGMGTRFIMIPSIDDKKGMFSSTEEIRDFIYMVYQSYKK